MKRLMSLIVIAVWTFAFAPAEAGVTVNCDAPTPESIQAALDFGETNLLVTGTCEEQVLVISDDVTIAGNPDGEIDGALTVRGALRFHIANMKVTASTPDIEGIWVTHGASATISGVMVSGEDEFCAILVFSDSFAEIKDSILDDNACGISVGVGSLVSGRRNVITNTEDAAVEVYQQSTYRSRDVTIDSSTSGGPTITLTRSSFLDLRDATVTGDIAVNHQSHLSVRGKFNVDPTVFSTVITGDISVDLLSELDLRQNSKVEGNIKATNLSIVRVTDGATVEGRVSCVGTSICMSSK